MSTKRQLDNLKKGEATRFSPGEHQARIAKKGAEKASEKRRQKKSFSEIAKEIGEKKITSDSIVKTFQSYGVCDKDGLYLNTAIVAGQAIAGMKGNTAAAQWVKELSEDGKGGEEYPPVKIPAEAMIGAFCDINRRISAGTVKEAILKGGRGGAKSSFPGLKIPEMIMSNPSIHALVMRNVANTLKDSVYAQIVWGIETLGVSERFKCTTSPMIITYLPTGQHIYFRGADKPEKIKSIKPPFGYIGILWFEEFDQYSGMEAVRKIKQSAIRGTDESGESRSVIFETFNPPPTAQAWVNEYVADIEARRGSETEKEGTEIVTSSYKDVPREWLGAAFISEAEELRRTNETAYRNEYLGEVTGTGGKVFRNLTIREITDAEIENFDVIRQGLDWGWFPDPNAFVRLYYNRAQKKIYIFDELKRNETSNEQMASLLVPYNDFPIIADSAEEKSINYFCRNGYRMTGATKPPGSVEYGIKWLCSLSEIIIDRRRCPCAAREFDLYEYLKNKDGEYISAYPDKDNHFIDATRYALNREIEESNAILRKVKY